MFTAHKASTKSDLISAMLEIFSNDPLPKSWRSKETEALEAEEPVGEESDSGQSSLDEELVAAARAICFDIGDDD